MKRLLLILLFISSPCLAMDRIGPVFQMTPQSPKEYYGQTNDRVYVSGAKQESRYYVEPVKESAEMYPPLPKRQKADVMSSSCVEFNGECQESKYFSATVK